MNNSFLQNDLRQVRKQLDDLINNTAIAPPGTNDMNLIQVDSIPVPTNFGYSNDATLLINLPVDNTLAQSEYYFPKMDQIYRFPYYYTDYRDISNQLAYEELNRVFTDVNVNLDNTEPRVYGTGLKITNKLVSTNNASLDWYSNWTIPDTLCHYFVTFRLLKRVSSFINTMTLQFGVKQVRMGTTDSGEGAYCFQLGGSTWNVKSDNVLTNNSAWNVDMCNGNPGLFNRSQIDLPASDPNYPLRYGIEYNRFTKQIAYYLESPLNGTWVLVHRDEISNPKSMKPFIHFVDNSVQAENYSIFFSEMTVQLCTDPSSVFQAHSMIKDSAALTITSGNYGYPLCARLRFRDEPAGNATIRLTKLKVLLDTSLGSLTTDMQIEVLYIDDFFDNLAMTGPYSESGPQLIGCLKIGENISSASPSLDPTSIRTLATELSDGANLVVMDLKVIDTSRLFGNDVTLDSIGFKQQSAIVVRILNNDLVDDLIIKNVVLEWQEY